MFVFNYSSKNSSLNKQSPQKIIPAKRVPSLYPRVPPSPLSMSSHPPNQSQYGSKYRFLAARPYYSHVMQ